jgi:hypothetical protein
MKLLHRFLLAAAVAASTSASADTIGYWRFENAASPGLDSGGQGRDLTPVNSPALENLTDPGPGQYFFTNQIPQNLLPNTQAARLWGTNRIHFVRAYETAFLATNQFTIEAFINLGNIVSGTTYPIASRFAQTGAAGVVNDVAWVFAIRYDGTTPRLRITASKDGIPSNLVSTFASALSLQVNHDYYVAMVFNGGSVTFYQADLAVDPPVLSSQTVTALSGNTYPAQAPFRVGAHVTAATTTNVFNGLIDEVRYSNRALSVDELLFSPAAPPQVVTQPANAEVAIGGTAAFSVTARGAAPLAYQWFWENNLISGATGSSLVLSNVSHALSGSSYHVVVSNFVSTTASDPAVLTVVDTSTPIIGYWRFEDENNLGRDGSVNGTQLANAGSPSFSPLPPPGSGSAGANFPRTVDGHPNLSGVQLDGTSWLSRPAGASVVVRTQLTVEAYFNAGYAAYNAFMPLASQYDETGNQRGWFFGVREKTPGAGDLQLRFGISRDGTVNGAANWWVTNASRWTLEAGKDYYAAATFDNGMVTFYLADLSNPVLQSETFMATVTNCYESAADFRVAGVKAGSVASGFPGLVDEVRLWRVAVAPANLLQPPAPVPTVETAPQDTTVARYSDATFRVFALGSDPLHYQWYAGDSAIPGATGSVLTLTNVQMGQSGTTYYAVITNAYGAVTSSPALLTVVDTSGSYVGYWRFENTNQAGLDFSGYGVDLTETGAPVAMPIPSSGPGASFPLLVPSTRQTNQTALQLVDGAFLNRGPSLSTHLQSQMTLEAFFNLTSSVPSVTLPLASQYDDLNGQRSWVFGLREDSPGVLRLRCVISRDGSVTSGPNFWAGNSTVLSLTTNRDYYAALVFNAGTLTFYLADLSATNPVVQSETLVITAAAFFDAATDFRVGAFQNTPSMVTFPGLLDEVRFSRVALPREYLLVNRFGGRIWTVQPQSGHTQISGIGVPGVGYIGQRSSDLEHWNDIALSVIADSAGNLQFTDPAPPATAGFYRLRQP